MVGWSHRGERHGKLHRDAWLVLVWAVMSYPAGGNAADTSTRPPQDDEVTFCGKRWRRGAESVQCKDAGVRDLAPLAGLKQLAHLDLSGSGVSELAPLGAQSHLRTVRLAGTRVADLTPLANHRWIESLDLSGTKVRDLSPLSEHTALTELKLNDSRVTSLSPALGLPKLRRLEFRHAPVDLRREIFRLAQSSTIHMTGEQVRLLALFRLLREKPAGLRIRRHANGRIEEVGILRRGRKEGWWATFDERGDLIEEQDFFRGMPQDGTRNWDYNRYNCVESRMSEAYFIRGCLRDGLTLTLAERLAVLKKAEPLLAERREDVARDLLAAIVDDPRLTRAIGALLVRLEVLTPEAAKLIPTEARLADQLERLTRDLDEAYGIIGPAHCRLGMGSSDSLRIRCTKFIDCQHACQERSAVLTLTISHGGTRLTSHDWEYTDRGRCGCCMEGF